MKRNLTNIVTLVAVASTIAACSVPEPKTVIAVKPEPAAKTHTVVFAPGELLQLASFKYVKGKDQETAVYLQKAFPLAVGHGMVPAAQFHIVDVVEGTYRPERFLALYRWPSQAAWERFNQDPKWPPISALRGDIYHEVRNSSFELGDKLSLELNQNAVYEVQVLRLSQDRGGDYDRYRQATHAALAAAGGRIVASLGGGTYQSLQPQPRQPDRIVIVEWPEAQARNAYLDSTAYQTNKHLLAAADSEIFLTRATPFKLGK